MATGKVLWFNTAKGFGYITPDDGGIDVRVYAAAVEKAGLSPLEDGQAIAYELERDPFSGQMVAGRLRD
jgi:CspA family cold shock protein